MSDFKQGDAVWVIERRPAVITGVDSKDPHQPYRVSYVDDGESGWPIEPVIEPRES